MNRIKQESTSMDPSQIQKWEQDLQRNGHIDNEGELLSYIKGLDMSKEDNRILASKALTIAAQSLGTKGQYHSLILAWMERAKELDPENEVADDYLSCFEWRRSSSLLNDLTFPPIRETDNRQAKKQTVDMYIMICQQFVKKAEEHMRKLSTMTHTTCEMVQENPQLFYQNILQLLEETKEEVVSLLKVTKDYQASLVGTFHTVSHLEDIKAILSKIEDFKDQWSTLFHEGIDENEEELTSALEELNNMIGLHSVKNRMNDFYQFFKYQKTRREKGFQTKDEVSLNMIITGNPGTGKTTLARLFAGIYYELGVLPRKEVIETNRSQLVGSFVGQTEENVRGFVEKALGGVLFIDEAYSLKREGQSGNDYGQTAIDTLVSLMTSTEYAGKFAVILAGYPEEMRQFLEANTGLRSRFPMSNYIQLPDYTNEELIAIGEKLACDNDYILTDNAKIALEERIEKEKVDQTFGNARTVRNIILDAIFQKGSKEQSEDASDLLHFSLLERENFITNSDTIQKRPEHKLNELIGLEKVKEEVCTLISFVKIQQMRRDMGLPTVPIQIHSVFTGNPGTGKTTVAKIYAEFLKEVGLLKRGHLIITSRADFVAGYVGQTALKTKRKIREALGGVLFIDEAYSLLGHGSGDFGKEVIDTLVDEMTKHNENLVVVLAGYPDEMKQLLDSNPGLQSRFKKFIHFADYSAHELMQIMKTYGDSFQFHLEHEAEKYVLGQLKETRINGNGRFATNLMNEAIQAQALRLISESDGLSDRENISTIVVQDMQKAWEKLGGAPK